jgi:hypothetical protein
MDAFSLLKADHQKVAGLFEQLESAGGQGKLRVFEQIKAELELHAHIEEKIFYPALEKPEETHDLTLEAYEEHDVVKKLLRELSRARTANEDWEAKAKVLQENVEHHVEEEENELFPKAEAALGDEAIERLGARMETEKARKQGRPAGKAASTKKSAASRKTAGKKRPAKKAAKKAAKKSGGTKKASKSASKSSTSRAAKRAPARKSRAKSKKR